MFDARAFLTTEIGQPYDVHVLFTACGHREVNQDAVRKWFERNNIPGDKLALLLCLLEIQRKKPVSLFDYFL
jgi:hypothetical protein